MLRRKDANYFIHVQKDGRWTIEGMSEDEAVAISHARSLLSTRRYDAAKVIREHSRFADKQVYFEELPAKSKVLSVAPVDAIPCCSELNDFYRYEAARTAGRLLRSYLDDKILSPWEVLHNSGQMKQLLNNDQLFNAMVQRAAAVQSRASGRTPLECMNELFEAAELIRRRAMRLGDLPAYVAVLRAEGAVALSEHVARDIAPVDREYYCRAAITEVLASAGSWEGKLQALLDVAQRGETGAGVEYLDEAFALLLDGAGAVKEILGPQGSLGESLSTLAGLTAGVAAAGGASSIERLRRILLKHEMPLTRGVLLERIERALKSSQPLARGSKAAERPALARVVQSLVEGGTLLGGGKMGEAIGRRAQLVFGRNGNDLPVRSALAEVLRMLPTRVMRANYLLGLSTTGLNASHEATILELFAEFMRGVTLDSEQGIAAEARADIDRTLSAIEAELQSGRLSAGWARMLAREIAPAIAQRRANGRSRAA